MAEHSQTSIIGLGFGVPGAKIDFSKLPPPENKTLGMNNTSADGAKLERAVASGMLTKLETGQIFLPRFNNGWAPKYETELLSWTGLPEETADQIDVTSYAVHHIDNVSSVAATK